LTLDVHFIGPTGEAAGDDIVWAGTLNAVDEGEILDAPGTAWGPIADEQTTAVGGEFFEDEIDLSAIEALAAGDIVLIKFTVDESASELNVANKVEIIGFDIVFNVNE